MFRLGLVDTLLINLMYFIYLSIVEESMCVEKLER